MNNVTDQKISTRLNDTDRKVLNKFGNDYIEISSMFPKFDNINPLLNNSTSNIYNNNHFKNILNNYIKL